jgi:hypothetical protein
MLRRTLYLIPALLAVTLIPARAASIICTLQMGASGPVTTQACNQSLSTASASLNWGTVLSANSGEVSGPVTASVDGDQVTVTSYDKLEGVDNTGSVWSSTYNAWVPAFVVAPGTSTFAGDFGAVTNSNTPTPPYGDNLLGIIAPGGNNPGNAQVTLNFAENLNFVEFQVTAESNVNFTATLIAYDINHVVLGTYTINDTGTGGVCSSLYSSNPFVAPSVCNPTSPFAQFYDPQDNIASVELTVSDTTGAFIDTLDVSPIPEPSTFAMFGIAMLILFWAAKRGKFLQFVRSTSATRD